MCADGTEQTTAQLLYLVFSLVCICYEICSNPENTFACHFLLFMKGDSGDCVFIFVNIAWPTSFRAISVLKLSFLSNHCVCENHLEENLYTSQQVFKDLPVLVISWLVLQIFGAANWERCACKPCLFWFPILIVLRVPASIWLSFNPRDFITNCSVSFPRIHRPTDAGRYLSLKVFLSVKISELFGHP